MGIGRGGEEGIGRAKVMRGEKLLVRGGPTGVRIRAQRYIPVVGTEAR